ncbi:MAG: 2-amino-4-hydroxy-6-hydroxymethyldihydropteridine diphosphokinase, partial [Sporomusaceae bacterium]|nr:2-amino-4-hydroxy-6-hydroxymethyldihydropteridine diphosphokinase [Sporomusaceae bacterium]
MIYLSLGSNMGNRASYLKEACCLLLEKQIRICHMSSFYETEPVGFREQPDFLNLVLAVETKHSPEELLKICLEIEAQLGRVRVKKWGPRVVDIDLILYHQEVRKSEFLVLPHPLFTKRRFVLEPLAEIAEDEIVFEGKTAKQLVAELTDRDFVRKVAIPFRVLFLSLSIGSGHNQAARVIQAELDAVGSTQRVPIITECYDVLQFLPQRGVRWFQAIYLRILRSFPAVYGVLYQWGHKSNGATLGRSFLNRLLGTMMEEKILSWKPDLIIATHATATGIATFLVKEKKLHAPVWAVVTDFVVHRLWLYQNVAQYFVAQEEALQFFIEAGVIKDKVLVTGIPVNPKFVPDKKKSKIREELNLFISSSNEAVILLMGGGDGLLPVTEIVQELDKIPEAFQFIVVTGRNQQIRRKLEKLVTTVKHTMQIHGYVENVFDLMQAADCIITKAGGVTLAEALTAQLPIIIYKPLAGQETGNAIYLERKNIAVIARSLPQLKKQIQYFLQGKALVKSDCSVKNS